MTAEYRPDPRLTKQTGAVIHVADDHVGWWPGRTVLDVYDFKNGCPDISYRLRSRGYEGSVTLNVGRDPQTLISSRQTIVLKLDWSRVGPFSGEWCEAGLMFSPEADSEYLVVYLTPPQGGNRCGVALLQLVDAPKGKETQKVDDVVPLNIKMGPMGISSERLCSGVAHGLTLAAQPSHP